MSMIEPNKPAFAATVAAAESSGQWRITDPLILSDIWAVHEPLLAWARARGLAQALGDTELRLQSLGLARYLSAIERLDEAVAPRVALALFSLLHTEGAALAALADAVAAAGAALDHDQAARSLAAARAEAPLDSRDLLPLAAQLLRAHGVDIQPFVIELPTTRLAYPADWHAPVNPRAGEVVAEVEAAFAHLGLLRSRHGAALFRDLAVAEYGGWACPRADADELFTVMAFLALWIFHDDALEGLGARAPELLADAVAGALAADDPACSDTYVRGWAALGRRLRARMSDAWLARHRASFLEWVDSVGNEEADLLRLFRRVGRPPRTEEYLHARRLTIGMVPTLGLVEYILGLELPQKILDMPEFVAFGGAAADAMAIHNDLFGLSKDSSDEIINLVPCRARELRSMRSAFQDLARTHERAISTMLACAERLKLAAGADEGLVARWLTCAGQLICGLGRWHSIAPRYSDIHRLADGTIVRIATIAR